ncbi:TetR/AcrR family transcriptional regulator [Natrarchaeobaculum sulfurireducens]|uniref:Transcriptional regulator, TetR family n=1 Tax=Natrarchaeobaculum sulfurireducens TaxID=2044521 RepID=A0A346PLZ3_9EURY|nr:TetR/AcrR family transcriptional regulator [Natrarchaeobaculum sulfurireducens]AXR76872.1 Transcriptional regulator, TetR/AcrR family [Natrarchaeobaculum sulfurireducens]AXR80538.1 Transcriptional regulator, TetR family [Natrarchaeobaculum sulfurireducens]
MGANGDGDPVDTQEAIMQATYRALCTHGYSSLTMQSIADEFDKTKGVIHYHYDTKQDLLVAFLEYLLDAFERDIAVDEQQDPGTRLEALIETLLFGPPERGEFDHWELTTAMLEIRSEAPHNPEFRRQLSHNYETVEAMVIAIVEDGIEQGVFRDVDAEEVATLLLTTINGARIYQVTLQRDDVAELTSASLEGIVRHWLRQPGGVGE